MQSTISRLYRTRVAPTLDKTTKPVMNALEKIPSEAYVATGVACCCAATALALSGKTKAAIVCATWAPMTLLVGLYLKHRFE
jgi:hypothetical protein